MAPSPNRAYLASCLRHSVQILASLGLHIPTERYTQSALEGNEIKRFKDIKLMEGKQNEHT